MNKMFAAVLTALSLLLITPAWASTTEGASTETIILYVDINSDSAEKMADLLKGIGIKKAEAIVSYRQENGPFTSVDDLLNVSGIGSATLEKNRALITLGKTD